MRYKLVSLSQVEENNRDKLVEFLVTFPGETRDVSYWNKRLNFWWEANPFCEGSFPKGWILWSGGQIVGFLAAIPGKLSLEGKAVPSAAIGIWRVLDSQRAHSLKLLLKFMEHFKNHWILSCTHNPTVEKILLGLKFKSLPGNYPVKYGFVIGWKHYLRKKFGNSILFSGPWIEKFEQLFWSCYSWKQFSRPGFSPEEYRINHVDETGLNQLWEASKESFSLTNWRTAPWLSWQNSQHPLNNRELIVKYSQNKIVGYALFWSKPKNRGLNNFECLDMWVKNQDEEIAEGLILTAMKIGKRNKKDFLICPLYMPSLESVFFRLGLKKISSNGMRYLIKPPKGKEKLDFKKTSYFVLAEGDYSL